MVNTLSGSVSAYRQESVKQRFIRIDEVMALLNITRDEAMEIALAAGARYQLAKITLVHKERLMKYIKHFTRVPSSNKIVEKKFVRIGEGSMTYSIGHHRFIEMARAAGAVYKIGTAKGNTILINLVLKNHFPSIKINASICNEIDNVQKARQFELAGANVLVLNRDVNRNFKMLKAIKDNTSAELKVLCTTPCVFRCQDVHYHANLSSTLSNELQRYMPIDEKNSISHTSVNCLMKKLVHLEENIKSPWIRPEDMKYYEEIGISLFKIDGRDRSAEYNIEIVKAYLNQSFDGNLLYLMKTGYPKDLTSIRENNCTDYLRLGIDNRDLDRFLEPFVKGTITCDNGCEKCQYCKRISKKIIYDKEWMNGFTNFLSQEIEKRYT